MTAFNKVQAGDKADLSAALGILAYNAQNCSPANNEPLSDFATYQVTESLAQFPLDKADNDVITWAFPDALNVQQDMTAVLKARHAGAARHRPGDADRGAGGDGRAADRDLRHLAQRGEVRRQQRRAAVPACLSTGRHWSPLARRTRRHIERPPGVEIKCGGDQRFFSILSTPSARIQVRHAY